MVKKEKLFLLDGYALAYRSYFAFLRTPLTNARGENTSAVYGFALTLLKILNEENPDYIGVALDSSGPTFRHELYTEYKATRQKMPDDLRYQIPWLKELLEALDIPVFEMPGFEADDIIGTLSLKGKDAGLDVFLATGDKDFLQLVEDGIYFYNIRTKDNEPGDKVLDKDGVKAKIGVRPDQVRELLALMGDSSDNIPGLPGVGEKTALKLLEEYGSLEQILANAENIKGKLGEKISQNKHLAEISLDLATIRTDLDISFNKNALLLGKPDHKKLSELLSSLEFNSLIEKFNSDSKRAEFDPAGQKYIAVTDKTALDDLIKELGKQDFIVFDTETTSLDPLVAELVGVSFSWKEKEAYYISVISAEGKHFEIEYLIEKLKPVFANPEIKKGGQNLKYDISVLKKYGVEVNGISFDTLIASYLLNPEGRKHNLDLLALDYLNYRKIPTSDLIGSGKECASMDKVSLEKVSTYGCEDAEITLRLKNLFQDNLQSLGLIRLFDDIEMPLVGILADMEMTGVSIDTEFLGGMSDDLEKQLTVLRDSIYEKAGEEFNIDSPQQLGKILFEKMVIHKELGIKRVRKTSLGYATDARLLDQMSGHPIVADILEYRHLRKLKSTYIDALPQLVHKVSGRIHTSYNQTITATGRLSSSDPNLQNIPIRTELGREIRKAFIPSDKDRIILDADYSQIEFRIAAHFSGDKNLIDFFKSGEDVHAQIAAMIYDIPIKEVTKPQRSRSKEISFGILYGMNQYGLASRLKISTEEAEEFLRRYFATLPGISEYIQRQLRDARASGTVTTLYGRRRHVSNIESDNGRLRSLAEHIAVNTPIQGTAADIIKIAMIRVFNAFRKAGFKSKMIMQVHDELVFDVVPEELDEIRRVVKTEMEKAAELSVPLTVEIGTGKNWLEAH